MVKQQCLFGTLLSIKVPGRHFLVSESWRKGVKMTETNKQSEEKEERIIEIEFAFRIMTKLLSVLKN